MRNILFAVCLSWLEMFLDPVDIGGDFGED